MNLIFRHSTKSMKRPNSWANLHQTLLVITFFLFAHINSNSLLAQTSTINVNMRNVAVEEVLNNIESKTDYHFLYNKQMVDVTRKVTVNMSNVEVKQILTKVFEETDIKFSMDGKQIVLRKGEKRNLINQFKKITGQVYDNTGMEVVGATVKLEGSKTGTITDMDGKFSIDAPENGVLNISYIGFNATAVRLEGQSSLKITLREDAKVLDELVVIGYGTQRRSMVASAISKVKIDENNMRNVASPSQLLEGRVAGITVSTTSGNLGSGERMAIRGASSLSASNEPLYVVDGIPITNTNASIFNFGESMSSLATLNLTDIESIEVLKDAASAAIYGSRATNGVVLITTKSGKAGRSEVKLNVNTGLSQFPNRNKLKFASSDLYMMQYNEGIDNYNKQYDLKVGDAGYKIQILNPFQGLPDTDWLSYITQTGYAVNADISFSGGFNKTNYYIGGNISSQEGIIKTNALQKINLKAKITQEVRSWLEVGANISGNYLKNSQVPGANLGSTIIARAVEQRPFDRPYKPNGEYYLGGTDELTRHNPVQILNEQIAYLDNFRYLGNFHATLKFNNNLTLRNSFNSDIGYTYDYTYYKENHPYGTGVGRIVEYNRLINNLLYENILNYNRTIGDVGFNGMLGHSFQSVSSRTSMIDGRGFPSPSFDVISVASEIFDASGNVSDYAMESYFGRGTLSYLEKYILTLTLRTDGSSKFAPKTRWGWFPSISLGWNMSKEGFMKDSGIEMKLRTSYGKTGNQEGIGNYAYQSQMSGGKNYGQESGISTSAFGNETLTWETADQFDIGVDVDFLKGRVNMIVDAYLKNTNNLLYSMPIAATTGLSSIMNNIGSMRNYGLEYTVNTDFKFGKVQWLSQFNIATNKNRITALIGDNDNPITIGSNRALQVGKELGAFYLFVNDGIYQYDGEVPQEQFDLGTRAGDVKWVDVDDNNIINDNDRQVVGSSNPIFFGGWNNTFKYRGIQLDIFTTYMQGNDVYAQWKVTGVGRIGYRFAVLEDAVNKRWTGPGTTNTYPRALNADVNNDKNSDRWLEDGSFIRLRTLTLGYNLPAKTLSTLKLKGVRLYLQGDNLLLLTRYSGWDPEVSSNMDPQYFGMDLFSVPQPTSMSIGANISF